MLLVSLVHLAHLLQVRFYYKHTRGYFNDEHYLRRQAAKFQTSNGHGNVREPIRTILLDVED